MKSFRRKGTSWHYNDTLNLTVDQWKTLLSSSEIFNEEALWMLRFVYHEPNHQSCASEIGLALGGFTQQKITSMNRKISKQIYDYYDQIPPNETNGGLRYWNVVFDGNPGKERNRVGHFFWRLRPNLVIALEALQLI